VRKQSVWNKEKYLEKSPNRYWNQDQNQFPKDSLFFKFSNTLKQIKIKLCSPKTLWNLAVKTLGKIENFALKNHVQISSRKGIYIASQKSAHWQSGKGKKWPSGRPPGRSAQRSYFWPLCLRSTGQHPRVKCFQSVNRAVDRPSMAGLCTSLVHIGRPAWSTDSWSGLPPVQSGWKSRTRLRLFITN